MIRIEPLPHRDADTAQRLHTVLELAHAQEAELLGAPPAALPARTAADIRHSDESFLGAMHGTDLLGAIGVGPDDEPGQLCISLLVVHPAHQRQGIARALLAEALRLGAGQVHAVATGAANAPALALYRQFGFTPYRHGCIGPQRIALLKLRRAAR